MKRYWLIFIVLILPLLSTSQIHHYFSYNMYVYGNFYNKEMDNIDLSRAIRYPMGSYKIKKDRLGAEIFFNYQSVTYNPLNHFSEPNDILWLTSANIGLAAHYSLIQHERIAFNIMLGTVKNWYDAMIFDAFMTPPCLFIHSERESKWGLLGGININVPIYKNIYTNANVRYSVFPTADFNKRNLITEVGIGYRLFQKGKE